MTAELFAAFRNDRLSRSAGAEQRQLVFEEACVLKLLRLYHLEVHRASAREDANRRWQTPFLTFAWFNETYPFPVQLASAKLRDTAGDKIGWTEIFGRGFMKLPWIREYQDVVAGRNADIAKDHVGLCFNAPHVDGGAVMVVHNFPPGDIAEKLAATRIQRTHRGVTFTIEQLPAFAAGVGDAWKP